MVELVLPFEETVTLPHGYTLEFVSSVTEVVPQLDTTGQLRWLLNYGLAVEAMALAQFNSYRTRPHGDMDVVILTDPLDVQTLSGLDWIGSANHKIRVGTFDYPDDLLTETVTQVTVNLRNGTSQILYCVHPAIITLLKLSDTRSLRDVDVYDLNLLRKLMNLSSRDEWIDVADRALPHIMANYRGGTERKWRQFINEDQSLFAPAS